MPLRPLLQLLPAVSIPPLLSGLIFLSLAVFPQSSALAQQQNLTGQPSLAILKLPGNLGTAAMQMLDSHVRQGGTINIVSAPTGAFQAQMELAPGNKLIGRLLSPAGKKLFERTYNRSDLDHDIRQFADDIVLSATKRPGIATSQIAFVSTQSGRAEIFMCDYDGRNVRQITRDGRNNISPAISPRGRHLVHTSHAPGYADLVDITLDGGGAKPLVRQTGAKTGAAYSRDGERIAYTLTVNGNSDLFTVDSGGGKAKALIATPAIETTPAWSPDGKQIVYSSNGGGTPQLYLIPAKGGKPQRLETGHPDCRKPGWSPDGATIAFVSGGQQPAVTLFDVRSKTSRVLVAGDDPAWGADSRHLVFVYRDSLYLTDTLTGKSQPIVSGVGTISEPSWTW